MKSITALRDIIEYQLENLSFPNIPKNLYDPIRYILSIGGKRTRPALTLMAHQLFNNEIEINIESEVNRLKRRMDENDSVNSSKSKFV